MTIYARIVTVIIATAAVIIISGLAVGAYFLTRHMSNAIGEDMMVVVDIADQYVASEIKLLKIQAAEAAEQINLFYQDGKREYALERVGANHPAFIGLAVFDATTMLDSWGKTSVPPSLSGEPFMDIAKAGGQVVSTTMYSPDGTLVMYVSTPMGDGLILAAVMPGQYFSDLLSRFKVYQTGHLFIDDENGHVIVNIRPEWVQNRINFMELAKENSRYKGIGDLVARGIAGEQGTAQFTVDRVPRICAFRPLSSPNEDWFLGIIAPLTESQMKALPGGMFIIGMITFVLSVMAAFLAALLIKRPYAEMDLLRETAVTALKAKSAFLAHMSHEIRTPLNAVIGLSELTIGEGHLSPETESNLEKIYSAGSTILSIVNDLLDISKIESGKFDIYPVKYDTPSLINDTVTLNIVRIGEKDIKFKLHVDERLPKLFYGDDLRVKQIFNNLLSNAFKFTNAGTVEWRVSFERDKDAVWLVSSVRDTGMGIKPADMQKLFSDYNQVDQQTNRRVEGTGLGLAITKRLVDMMEGTIAVESEYGQGATFHVRLRQGSVSDTPIGKEVAENLMGLRYTFSKRSRDTHLLRADMSYAHVLVVDDIVTNLDVAKGMMKPYKMQIDCASSGRQAIDMIRAGSPRYRAIFMDHMMPGLDGVEATRIIREEIGTDYARNIPIIALTANAVAGNEELFLSQGFQAFISKPIDIMKLDATLRRWVRDKSLEKELSAPEEDALPGNANRGAAGTASMLAGIAIKDVDKDRMLERFGGNEMVFLDVLRSYATNTRPLLNSLRAYLAAENCEDYAIVIHGIKGSSYGVCAQEIGKAAELAEMAAKTGNIAAVKSRHLPFEKIVEDLLDNIDKALVQIDAAASRPVASEPAPELLRELREACAAFDMDRVDKTMAQLEACRYENGGQLVAWLREQVDNMTFENVFNGEWPSA